ncbi:MAG: HlyD family secretion protein [Colwellia sp.]|jgi:RND family efflux transporter MFP subunit
MPQSTNQHPDIYHLKIDRKPQITKIWCPTRITNICILLLVTTSAFYLVTLMFFPTNTSANSKAQQVVEINHTDQSLTNTPIEIAQDVNNISIKNNQVNNTILDASGHIVARRIATVSSQVTGKLEKLNIEEGQRVTKSEVLAVLDDRQAIISYQLALAELAAKQADFEEWVLLSQQQTQHVNRNKSLAKQQLISEQLLEDSQFKNAQLAIKVKNKQALVQVAKQSAALAQYQLNQHKIRAPFDGVVISKNAQVGELISAGSSGGGFIRTGVGTIVDMSSLEIEVEVGESYINRVFAGQKVIAKLDAYPQWQINSEVVAVIPTANRQKASIKVRVKLFQSDPRILPDMGVKVSFIRQHASSDLTRQQVKLSVLLAN